MTRITKTKKETAAAPIISFKGFDKDFACRGFQFEVGKTYTTTGKIVACKNGFHACENPFDVWSYYPFGKGRYALVEQSGSLARHADDSKVASAKITIKAELTLPDFIRHAVAWVVDYTKGKDDNPGGYHAHIGSSGDYAHIGSSGYRALIGSSGDHAHIGSGGYHARIGSSGDYAHIGSSGDYADIATTGRDAVVACARPVTCVTLGPNGCASVPWHDGKRWRIAVAYAGENGIEAGIAYTVNNRGEFERFE
jgi:hypothetical protein